MGAHPRRAGGSNRKERPNPSRAVGNCPDDRRILHIVAQTAPAARNRTGPDQDAEQGAPGSCGRRGAIKPACPHHRPIMPDASARTCHREHVGANTSGRKVPPRSHRPLIRLPVRPYGPCLPRTRHPRAKAHDTISGPPTAQPTPLDAKSTHGGPLCPFAAAPRPDLRPALFRFDEYDNDAHLGHGNSPSSSLPVRTTLRPPPGTPAAARTGQRPPENTRQTMPGRQRSRTGR